MPTQTELMTPSYLMTLILPQMKQLRAAYEGGMTFKKEVLIARKGEDKNLFKDKIENVAAQPVCKSIIEEMIDIIFEQDPHRDLAFLNSNYQPITTPLWMEDFIVNADLENNTLSDVMETAATLASIEGWSWIFADLPEEAKEGNRPYLSVTSAENVIDYEYDTEGATSKLCYMKIIEFQDQEKMIIKTWEAGEQYADPETGIITNIPTLAKRYCIDLLNRSAAGAEMLPDEIYEFPWDYQIPAHQCIPVPDLRNRFIGSSDITDAADVQRELLRLEAEAFDSIRFSKPLIRAKTGTKIPAGGGGIARGDKDDVEVFEIPTADIDKIRSQQDSIIKQLDAYMGRSNIRNTKTQSQSGISIVEERRGLHRKAATRARIMQSTEEQVFELVAWLMNLVWAGKIEYNTDYEAKDTQFRLALLKTAKELSINPVVQSIIDLEVIRLIAPPDELASYLQKVKVSETSINNIKTMNETAPEEVPGTETEIED